MTLLYVREQGSVLRKRGSRILVEKQREVLYELPLAKAAAVAVFGNVQVTTQALSEMLERRVPLALFTRNGRLKGRLLPAASGNVFVRLAQYRAAEDERRALELARASVAAKLLNCAALIQDYRAHYPSGTLAGACEQLQVLASRAVVAASASELLGYEGAGGAAYFEVFPSLIRCGLDFPGRRRHPPTDPVNALLSLGYTMLGNELHAVAEGIGLDPYLGFLHRPDYGRPSLALDLLEAFRPSIDRLTLRIVNERILTEEDFARRVLGPLAGGVVLISGAWERYLEAYEHAMTESRRSAPEGLREAVGREPAKLAAALSESAVWAPFLEEPGCCS